MTFDGLKRGHYGAGESFLKDHIALHCGDCRDVLATLTENSLDACVTDPPYGLEFMSVAWDTFARPKGDSRTDDQWSDHGSKEHARTAQSQARIARNKNAAFEQFSLQWAQQVYRVLKPGAHLIAFGGDRTFHRLACAIEDAGFKIRGTIAWIFGQGFPKNLNVSKRLRNSLPAHVLCACAPRCQQTVEGSQSDYQSCHGSDGGQPLADEDNGQDVFPLQGDARAHSRGDLHVDARGEAQASIFSGPANDHRANGYSQRQTSLPSEDYLASGSIPFDKQANTSLDELTVAHKTALRKSHIEYSDDGLVSSLPDVNLPRCPNCGKFEIPDGLGTSLKPAMELICLARKPLSEGTVAANVLRWGTGAINVDGCRVEHSEDLSIERDGKALDTREQGWNFKAVSRNNAGRWPANVVHDGSDEVVAAFPDADGGNFPNGGKRTADTDSVYGSFNGNNQSARAMGDSGSAARFFYTAKADAMDRIGSRHPTIKPLDLMQWLVRLVTSPRGTVLDPFAGTGTTGEAAWREGMSAVLIEAEPEYQTDIRRRMALALAGPDERQREGIKAKNLPRDDGPLFGGTDLQNGHVRKIYGEFDHDKTGKRYEKPRDDGPLFAHVSRETWAQMWQRPFDFSQEPRE